MKKIITYGTFDLITPGHIEQLRESKKMGDYLIVGLSTDEFNAVKGKKSYLTYDERRIVLESIKYVDKVIPEENWEQKVKDIKKYKVSILTMGADWEGSDKFEYLKEYCEVKFIPRSFKYSSTNFRLFLNKHKNDNTFIYRTYTFLKKIFLYVFKYHLKFMYFFIKLFSYKKNRLFLLSRQYNFVPINYQYLIDYINKTDKDLEIKVFCKKINPGIINKIKYYFSFYKQMFFVASSKVVIVDGYNPIISILKHKKNTTIIQMWHALGAIKKFGYQTLLLDSGRDNDVARIMQMHNNYDYVISGSKAMVPFFSEAFKISEQKILTFGTPSVDYLLDKSTLDKEKIYREYPELKNKTIITYSPTFRNDARNNVDSVVDAININKYALIVTVHPSDMTKLNKKEGVLYNPNINFFDLIKLTDYFITDYSAAMLDAAIVKAKLLLYVYDYHLYEKENGINIDLFKELPGYTSKNIEDLIKIIEKDKYNMEILENFRTKYINNLTGDSTEKLYSIIKESL